MKNLKKALKDTYGKEIFDDILYAKNQPDHKFSQVHNQNMKEALEEHNHPVITFLTRHTAKVACVVVLGFTAFMIGSAVLQNDVKPKVETDKNSSVSQVTKENETEKDKPANKDDENISNGEFVVGEKGTEFGTDIYLDYEEPGMETIEEIECYYNPTFIPDGFELDNSTGDVYKDTYYGLTYQKGEDPEYDDLEQMDKVYWSNRIFYGQFLKQKYTDVLVGNNVMSEIEDNGITYTVINYSEQNTRSFMWKNKYYVFLVDVPITFTIEEGLEICRSVEATNEVIYNESIVEDAEIKNFYVEKQDDLNRLYYIEYFMETVNEIKSHYSLSPVPEDFELSYTSSKSDNKSYFCSYENESNEYISFAQTLKQDFEVFFSEECVDIGTYENYMVNRDKYDCDIFIYTYKDGDIKYTISESKESNARSYIWPMEHYILQVVVPYDFTMEQGLEICKSVTTVNAEDKVYLQ